MSDTARQRAAGETLDALTFWGQQGYDVRLYHGMTFCDEALQIGWSCLICYMPKGSVSIGSNIPSPYGFHPTDPIAAARIALRLAGERWPDVVERMMP